jgi:hypothetical protein
MNNITDLLIGCSFTDPQWQPTVIPWSINYADKTPSYIVAQAGMGIKGIITEAMYFLENTNTIDRCVVILPDLWRIDIELDNETYIGNAMVDVLVSDSNGYEIFQPATRKWVISGGITYDRTSEYAKIFDFLYKHQSFYVILKEQMRYLKFFINHCKNNNIEYHISAISDPMPQMQCLDFIIDDVNALMKDVEYESWFTFAGMFIDEFLGHNKHPTTEEHIVLTEYIKMLKRK